MVALTGCSLSRGLRPSPLIPQLLEGSGSGPGNTHLRQTSGHFLELHRLLIMGTEVLDGVGKGHSEVWGHRIRPVRCGWSLRPRRIHLPPFHVPFQIPA